MEPQPPSSPPEEPSFESFFVVAEPRLRQASVARLGAERGREAAAEALAWAFENWDRVSELEHPIAYLYRVGVSRTRGRRPAYLPERTVVTPEPEPELWRAVRRLSEAQRQTVVLVCAYDWTLAEVAEVSGRSVSSVNTHLRRGLRHLRDQLGAEHDAVRFLDTTTRSP